MEFRWLTASDVDAVIAAGHLFDDYPTPEFSARFFASPNHHLCVAYVDGASAGFVSGVEMCHPDKGSEMFLYELGVDEGFRGRGIGAALVSALADFARGRGCYGMWVLTDADNDAAMSTYRRAGGNEPSQQTMIDWRF